MIGFFVMHYTAGLILSLVFQLAHVIGEADMPLPEKKSGNMKNSWAVHQLKTTVNFSTKIELSTGLLVIKSSNRTPYFPSYFTHTLHQNL